MDVPRSSRARRGGLRESVRRVSAAMPDATIAEIAEAAGCHPDTVRKHLGSRAGRTPGLSTAGTSGGVLPRSAADDLRASLGPLDVSHYLWKMDLPQQLGGPEHYARWRGRLPEDGHARSVRRRQRRQLRNDVRAVAAGEAGPYPKACASADSRDRHDCAKAVAELEMTAQRFGSGDVVAAVMRRRRALLGRRAARRPSVLAVRREVLRLLVRQDVFREWHQPGRRLSADALDEALDRSETMCAAAGL